jgi:hypothetical protein
LTDGSVAGDWRLPNRNELASLLDLGTLPPLPAAHPFLNFVADDYWSSSTTVVLSGSAPVAWFVNFVLGGVDFKAKALKGFVTAVRGGL